jgi:dienelactone hydrolase
LLVPSAGQEPVLDVIAIPDADLTPEQIVGLAPGAAPQALFARQAARLGCRVVVPMLISRDEGPRHGRAVLTNREFLYRPSFELGQTLVGYEVQKVLAVVDWLQRQRMESNSGRKIAVLGTGEGGLLALYAAALDRRIDVAGVGGFFGPMEEIWHEPIDRNVFGLLDQFGAAELWSMVYPRTLVIEPTTYEKSWMGRGGAPASLSTHERTEIDAEIERGRAFVTASQFEPSGKQFTGPVQCALYAAGIETSVRASANKAEDSMPVGATVSSLDRQARQIAEIDRYNQLLLAESPYVRQEFMKELYDAAGKGLDAYQAVAEKYRQVFYDEVIGRFGDPLLPPNIRTRKAYDNPKWTGYEVVLDVWPDVFAYGVLLLPKDLQPGERRPVVVCQHGLEGRPRDTIEGDHGAYHDFAAKLAEQGFITFAPQNIYIFEDRFRTLQRKANPLGKTLFSIMVPQHEQITRWLASLPQVDPNRIAFYGLSYGGKSAMRIPPLVDRYCLSICSADFNEWVWKNASTRSPYSYVWSGEYEIFEFNLGSTFNYAEMAALIAPRPFMVERGHFDGVAPDETVAYEFAKVRHHYAARLGLADRCEIEFFVGPHTIHGQGTFDFLRRHLAWKNDQPGVSR